MTDHQLAILETSYGWVRKHFWLILGMDGVKDILRELLKGKMMEWLVAKLGGLGRFIYEDPFSILTIVVVCGIVRLLWILFLGSLRRISPIAGAGGEVLYRPVIEPKIAKRISVTLIFIGTLVVCGYIKYRNSPAILLSETGSFYGVGIKNSFLYIAVNIKNYSPVSVKATVDSRLICGGSLCGDEKSDMFFPPWEADHFHGGLFLPLEPDLKAIENDPKVAAIMKAFFQNKLEVEEVVHYNDGQKGVTYDWVGRLNHLTVDFKSCQPPSGCQGNIDLVRSEYH